MLKVAILHQYSLLFDVSGDDATGELWNPQTVHQQILHF
jgi:hypothetical protein